MSYEKQGTVTDNVPEGFTLTVWVTNPENIPWDEMGDCIGRVEHTHGAWMHAPKPSTDVVWYLLDRERWDAVWWTPPTRADSHWYAEARKSGKSRKEAAEAEAEGVLALLDYIRTWQRGEVWSQGVYVRVQTPDGFTKDTDTVWSEWTFDTDAMDLIKEGPLSEAFDIVAEWQNKGCAE